MSTSRLINKTRIGNHIISTVELPGDLWFETMVFQVFGDKWEEVDLARYDTEDEAIKGHQEMVRKWEGKLITVCYICGDPIPVGNTVIDENEHGDQVEFPCCQPCSYDLFGEDKE